MKTDIIMAIGPLACLSERKKLFPALLPIAKAKIARPTVPSSSSIVTRIPRCAPNADTPIARKRTAAASNPIPPIFKRPKSIPKPIRRNMNITGYSSKYSMTVVIRILLRVRPPIHNRPKRNCHCKYDAGDMYESGAGVPCSPFGSLPDDTHGTLVR